MKIAVAGGHSKKCPGASKYIDEYTEDRKVVAALIDELKNRGHSVVNCSNEKSIQSAELAEECRLANNSGAKLFIAIHFNAGGGTGTEVWHYTSLSSAKSYANKVSSAVASKLGLKNRGAKGSTGLYVLKHTSMTAILVEVCFVDTKNDADTYKKVGYQAVAAAIADAVSGTNAGATTNTNVSTSEPASSGSSSGDISVDGWIGVKTNKKAQKYFGLKHIDGVMSNQDASLKKYFPRIDSKAINYNGGNGSDLVGAMQRLFGVKDDGFMGPKTVKAMQKYLGVSQDGVLGQNTASAWQRWLNAR